MNWYIDVLKNYAVFNGRARRKEYWMFVLINMIVSIVLNVIQGVIGLEIPWISIIYMLGVLLPSIGVAIRRLHDTDRSGWWLLISFIPVVGTIVLIVFLCQNGTAGNNRFGADPKAGQIN
ncbi:DUF805 domain-containing protein [Citrobacter sp. RHB25-C09]|uniref:DUF805 domain-containing protein n=1 Tax=Citrobacter sp. RHB25-C09 TaxID=2742624 RepID=UPI0015EF2486|nr:DUF805 domain-containing protein [Citrobacter sp. RHB25-C09]QMI03841.1 DUF805 domain-containing protein [Citrobacter sp. RHB25-C09]